MKAMVIREFGDPNVFELAEVQIPSVTRRHVLL